LEYAKALRNHKQSKNLDIYTNLKLKKTHKGRNLWLTKEDTVASIVYLNA